MSRLIKSVFEKSWDCVFIADATQDKTFTYSNFFSVVMQYKFSFEALGVIRGDKICLLMENSLDLAAIYFTGLIMGLVVIPIDPAKGSGEINEILKISGCKKLFHNFDCVNFGIDSFDIRLIQKNIDFEKKSDLLDLVTFDQVDLSALYLVAFTSGSTGVPKGVMHSFGNLVASALAFKQRFNFNDKNIFYHILPMTYMAGILNLIILPFVAESKIVLGPRFDVSRVANFWNIPVKYGVNTFWLIPTIVSLLLRLDRDTKNQNFLHHIGAIICVGTAPLGDFLKHKFQDKYKIDLYESYGLSETLFVSTTYQLYNKAGVVGPVLNGVALEFDVDGEILIDLPWMFQGYLNMENSNCFYNKKFKSGDVGMFDQDGFLAITDRKKDLIIKGGINISPAKLFNFIAQQNVFDECVVLGFPDDILGEKAVCFFSAGQTFDESQKKIINTNITQALGRSYCVDQFVRLESLPKNLNGKIDKIKLKKLHLS